MPHRSLNTNSWNRRIVPTSTPGEIEWRNCKAWIENGLPRHNDYLSALAGIADRLGVETFWDVRETDR